MKVEWGGFVENGKLDITDRAGLLQAISMFAGEVRITVESYRGKRSNQQNKYLWAVVYKLLADHTGYIPDEIHEICKFKFNVKKYDFKETEEHIEVGGSTTELTTEEFSNYCEDIRRWASGLGVVIPDPDAGWAVK